MAESEFTGLPVEEEDAKETKKPRWTVDDQIYGLMKSLREIYEKKDATAKEKNLPFEVEANIAALVQLSESNRTGFNTTINDIVKITKLGKKDLIKMVEGNAKKQKFIDKSLDECPFIILTSRGIVPEHDYIAQYLIDRFDIMAIHAEGQEEGLALWRKSGNSYSQLSEDDLFLTKEMQEVMREWKLESEVRPDWINDTMVLLHTKIKTIVQPREGMFPVMNGILDIKAGNLTTVDDGKICLVRSNVVYDPDAKCPMFDKYLLDVFAEDQRKIDALLSWLGAIVAGKEPQIIVMLKSRGRSGKDVLMSLVAELFGSMLTTMSPNQLYARFSNWAFLHRRVVFIEEFDGKAATVNKMKALSGGVPAVTFETKGVQAIMSAPVQCAIFINTNRPLSFEKGDAWEERFKLLDFPHSYLDEPDPRNSWEKKVDRSFTYCLKPELPGILNKILPYARYALDHPGGNMFMADISYKEIEDSLDKASNSLSAFIDEHCERAPLYEDKNGIIRAKHLSRYKVSDTTFMKKYEEYCDSPEVNATAWDGKVVKKELRENHGVTVKDHDIYGIRMKKNVK